MCINLAGKTPKIFSILNPKFYTLNPKCSKKLNLVKAVSTSKLYISNQCSYAATKLSRIPCDF